MLNKLVMSARLITGSYTPFLLPFWGQEEVDTVNEWLRGESYHGAPESLERKIASSLNGQWRVWAVNLGRSAIQVALQAMRLPQNSEVLVPSFACTGVVMPVIQAGLRPVFVDVDEQFNVRLESVLEADGPSVRAVVVSHLSGCWAIDTEAIVDWASSRGVFVIEDVAQAQGLVRNGKPAGTFGDVGVFSANGGKIIFGSGGGWLITRNNRIVEHLAGRQFASEPRRDTKKRINSFMSRYAASGKTQGRRHLKDMYLAKLKTVLSTDNESCSYDAYSFPVFSMSDIEAQLLLIQMKKVDAIVERRRNNADRWRQCLTSMNRFGMHYLPEQNNVHTKMLVFLSQDRTYKMARSLRATLFNHGVETETSYTPLHLRPAFGSFRRTAMPNTERKWRTVFSVPVRPNLDDVDWKRIRSAVSAIASAGNR